MKRTWTTSHFDTHIRALLLLLISASTLAAATTYTTADCSESAFQHAVNSASDGDTVQGPLAGGSDPSWTTRLNVNTSLIINGNGCNITLSGTDFMRMLATNAAIHPRITNFNISGSNSSGVAAIWMDGNNANFRVDHITFTFTSANQRAIAVDYGTHTQYTVQTYGVIDHNTFNATGATAFILIEGANDAWFNDPAWGTANAIYIENNTFVWNTGAAFSPAQDVVDGESGGRAVVRYNDITDGFVDFHDTGSSPEARGMRILERYNNTFHGDTSSLVGATVYRGGNGMDFNNSIPMNVSGVNGFQHAITTGLKRLFCETDAPSGPQVCGRNQLCDCGEPFNFAVGSLYPHAVCSSFRGWCATSGGTPTNQACSNNSDCGGSNVCHLSHGIQENPPNDAACGTGYQVVANIDGPGTGSPLPLGYPARDQAGVSKDDPITHAQTAGGEPSYSWNLTDPNNGNAVITGLTAVDNSATGRYILPNRDYYQQVVPFTGATGVGVGLLSARPASCTPKVGYWATDTNTLYQCSSANTWTAYYTPYTYPHPLQGGGGAPAAPTGLSAVTQ
jgi:hypothetical protein